MTMPPEPARTARLLDDTDLAALPTEAPDRVLRYGEHPDQRVDLYLPSAASPAPVVVLVHGGCWRQRWDRTYFGAAARDLVARGFAVANLEYRRIADAADGPASDRSAPPPNEHAGRDPRRAAGGWPTTFLDVAAGLDALADADAPIDLDRVVAVGHSAGGHLAQWLSTRAYLPVALSGGGAGPVPLRGIVVLAGVPDLVRAVELGVCGDAPVDLLGGPPGEQAERYRLASPSAQPETGVPVIHLVGADDDVVSAGYLQGCVLHGPLEVLPECGHIEPVVPSTAAWSVVVDRIVRLLA